jgi:hypothetical protein
MSGFSRPPAEVKNFMPLRLKGRCDAVIMMAPSYSYPGHRSIRLRSDVGGSATNTALALRSQDCEMRHRWTAADQGVRVLGGLRSGSRGDWTTRWRCNGHALDPRLGVPGRMVLMNIAGVVARPNLATLTPHDARPAAIAGASTGLVIRGSRPICAPPKPSPSAVRPWEAKLAPQNTCAKLVGYRTDTRRDVRGICSLVDSHCAKPLAMKYAIGVVRVCSSPRAARTAEGSVNRGHLFDGPKINIRIGLSCLPQPRHGYHFRFGASYRRIASLPRPPPPARSRCCSSSCSR